MEEVEGPWSPPRPEPVLAWVPTRSGDILGPAPLLSSRFRSTSESTYSLDLVFQFYITRTDTIDEAVVHMGKVIRRIRPNVIANVVSGDIYTLTYSINGRFEDEDPTMPPPRPSVKRLIQRLYFKDGKLGLRKT